MPPSAKLKLPLRWAGKARHACRNLLGLKAGKGL